MAEEKTDMKRWRTDSPMQIETKQKEKKTHRKTNRDTVNYPSLS